MELIKSWAFSICIAGVAITITQILIPKGSVNKTLEIVLRVFLLSIIVSPVLFSVDFKGITEGSFQNQIESYSQSLKLDMNSMIEEELSLQIEEMIKLQLAEIDVTVKYMDVKVAALGKKEAEIESVYIQLDSAYKIKDTDIRYIISKTVKCEINIKYVEDI